MSINNWHGVPLDHVAAWRETFNKMLPSEGAHPSSACPVCGEITLHRYFSLEKLQPRVIREVRYKGPGSYWEWCSSCRSFEHMSGYVPFWWNFDIPGIDRSKLTAIPDLIDRAMHDQ